VSEYYEIKAEVAARIEEILRKKKENVAKK